MLTILIQNPTSKSGIMKAMYSAIKDTVLKAVLTNIIVLGLVLEKYLEVTKEAIIEASI